MGVEVEVKDTGANRLRLSVKGLAQSMVFGALEDADPYPDGTSVAQVLAVQEFGAGPVPARAPLRKYVDGGGSKEIGDVGEQAIGKAIDGARPDTVSKAMGEVAVAGVRKLIENGLDPELAESTKANPERDTRYIPLLDTGHLSDSIDWTEVGS